MVITPQVSSFEIRNNRFMSKLIHASNCYIVCLVYPVSESTTRYNELVLEERKMVENSFYSTVNELVKNGFQGITVDSSGCIQSWSSVPGINDTIPIHEILEYLPETRPIFKTLELGCCSAYSHHILGTRCLCCMLIAESLSDIPESILKFS